MRLLRLLLGGRPRFSTQLLLQQIFLTLFVVALVSGVGGWLAYQGLSQQLGSRSLAVAQSLAEERDIREPLEQSTSTPSAESLALGPVQLYAQQVRERVGALFVVVTDRNGMRWAHPNPDSLGKLVSTDPGPALSGQEVTLQETGTLGPSIRSKVPIYSFDRMEIVGEVSVGYSTQEITDEIMVAVLPIAGVAMIALLVGIIGSFLLIRRLTRLTLGLQPEEIGELVQDQEAVLYGVDDGVLGFSEDRTLTVCNEKARELLKLPDSRSTEIHNINLPTEFVDLLDRDPKDDLKIAVDGAVLVISVRKVTRGKHNLGWVVLIRDISSVQALSRKLDAVGSLSAALRIQRHEFSNRLHTISGLLNMGRVEEGLDFLHQIMRIGPVNYPLGNSDLIKDTYLLAFLGAKSIQASERGVQLRISDSTDIHGSVSAVQNVTSVLGNLVDNAVNAAVLGENPERFVEVELLGSHGELVITVSDSGDGIEETDANRIFEDGYSQTGKSRFVGMGDGIGLTLARQLAHLDDGDVQLYSRGTRGGPGAVFIAHFKGVLTSNEGVNS